MTFTGRGVVWNAKAGKALCNLNSGSYTTENADEIKILKSVKGISYTEYLKTESKKRTIKSLKSEAKELGIKGSDRMTREELEDILK